MLAFLLSNKKLIAQAAGIAALLTALYQLYDHVYDVGYDAAITKITAEQNKQYEALRLEYEVQTQKAIDLLNDEHSAALSAVKAKETVVVKTKLVKEYVTEQIEVPGECDDLAVNVMQLLHDSTDIISTTINESTGSTYKF